MSTKKIQYIWWTFLQIDFSMPALQLSGNWNPMTVPRGIFMMRPPENFAHGKPNKNHRLGERMQTTIDGRNPDPSWSVVYPCLSHYLPGLIHPKWAVWDFFHQQYHTCILLAGNSPVNFPGPLAPRLSISDSMDLDSDVLHQAAAQALLVLKRCHSSMSRWISLHIIHI